MDGGAPRASSLQPPSTLPVQALYCATLRRAVLWCRPQKAPAFGAPPSHLSLSARPPPPQAAVTGVRWINWKLDPAPPMRLFNRRCGRAPHLTSTLPARVTVILQRYSHSSSSSSAVASSNGPTPAYLGRI